MILGPLFMIYIAYFFVHSFANSWYFPLSVLYILAISGTRGSSGFGSHSNEQIDNKTEKKQTHYMQGERQALKL